jgi:glutamyl-tRNA synthetase
MIANFSIDHISVAGPVFDVPKLDWLNGKYLRDLPPGELLERLLAWSGGRERLAQIVALAQARIERLSDAAPLLAFLYAGRIAPAREALLAGSKLAPDDVRRALALAMWELDAMHPFDRPMIDATLKGVAERLAAKFRDLARIYYVAMTGSPTSIPLFEAMELLGRDLCRERFRNALEALGGVTSAEERAWRRHDSRAGAA